MPIFSYQLSQSSLPEDVAAQLFVAWMIKLSEDQLGIAQHGSSKDTFSFGEPAGRHFNLSKSGLRFDVVRIVDLERNAVKRVVEAALDRVAALDYGSGVIYQETMSIQAADPMAAKGIQFIRTLGDQVHIDGQRKLSDIILLEFKTEPSVPISGWFLASSTRVTVSIFAPGPCASDLTVRYAAAIMETVAAICAFASGRPAEYKLPVFPVRTEEELARLKVLRHDPAVLGLARDGISLNIFNFPLDTILRLRGSLLAYHAALQQLSPDVAGMLFVTAIEALFSPRAEWRKEKATQRFIKSLIELCPEAIDQIASHANVEEAFSWKRKGGQALQRKEMLDAMYESRSDPTHAGLGISNTGVFSGMASPGGMRVALLSDLSRAAILEFLKAPRSSLIGHPMFAAPPATGK